MTEEDEEVVEWWWPGLGSRLGAIIRRIGTKREAAKVAGVTTEQLRRWEDGKSKMPLYNAYLLCRKANISVDWLLTGHGQTATQQGFGDDAGGPPSFPAGLDENDLLKDRGAVEGLIAEVEAYLRQQGIELSPKRKAALIIYCTDQFRGHETADFDPRKHAKLFELLAEENDDDPAVTS